MRTPRPHLSATFHRWLHRPLGRRFVQTLVVLLVLHGTSLDVLFTLLLGDRLPIVPRVASEAQAANASRIFTIDPPCAGPGDMVRLTGNGYGALNVTVRVHGLLAQVVEAYGHTAVFIVPANAPAGITTVTATNPGGHTGTVAFRVRGPEICGDGTDNDCSGVPDDPAQCTPVNHPPVANAGADQTAPVGSEIHLDATGSTDPDGDSLVYQWSFASKPTNSSPALDDATSPTPTFIIDQAGTYTLQLVVGDGQTTDTDSVTLSTSNSAPVAHAGPDQTGVVGSLLTLDGSASSDIDGDLLTYQWSITSKPAGSLAALSDLTAATPSIGLDVAGEYEVQLVVKVKT
jgi:hypothetical protein